MTPPRRIAAAPVPSSMVGADVEPAVTVADPARAVTVSGAVETLAFDVCPVVTRLVAGPVALAGTFTVAPTCVETVLDDPLMVILLPFGNLTIAPEGTITDSFAAIVTAAPAANVADPAVPGPVAVELPPPPQATSIVLTHDTKMARKKIVMFLRSLINAEEYNGVSLWDC
jgi:hypothetical protein